MGLENQSLRGDDISKKPINMSDTKLRLQRRCSEPVDKTRASENLNIRKFQSCRGFCGVINYASL